MIGTAQKSHLEPGGAAGGAPMPPNVVDDAAHLVIDPFAGMLEAVNLAGRRLLHLAPETRLPVAMDNAMPGLRRLRAISNGATQSEREELLLWCCGKPVRVSAEVLKETMSDGRSRMVVRALNSTVPAAAAPAPKSAPVPENAARTPDARPAAASVAAPAPDDGPETTAPPVARDDRDTLREIARRIRAGHTADAPKAANDAAPSPPPAEEAEPAQVVSEAPPMAERAATPANPVDAPQAAEGTPLPPRQPAGAVPDARTLSKVAHELKTPLSAIVAAAEIMRDEQLGPMGNQRYLGYAGDIHESARHALDVINAMLGATPRETRSSGRVDLNALVTATVSALIPLATSSGVGLEADTGEGRLDVHGDATGIRQIIYNLVSNALKFTPSDGYVHVATGLLPDGTPYFVVRDTGEGMSEDEIVEAFYAEATGPRRGGGYGIGLPMVRRLAEVMGATIDVDSTPGKGTVVLVSFPFAR